MVNSDLFSPFSVTNPCAIASCKALEARGIKVSEQEFTCPGAMGPIKAGHPDATDIENYKAFIQSVIGN